MKLTKLLMAVAIAGTVSFVSCKPKDADIKTSIEAGVKGIASELTGASIDVKDGVATISGVAKDDAQKAAFEKAVAEIKNVKSVVNNVTVAPPAPASLTTTLDAATQQKVKDGIKDLKGLTIAGFSGVGAIINGTVSASENVKFRQMLASTHVMLDAASKITVK